MGIALDSICAVLSCVRCFILDSKRPPAVVLYMFALRSAEKAHGARRSSPREKGEANALRLRTAYVAILIGRGIRTCNSGKSLDAPEGVTGSPNCSGVVAA